jgi:hypothetical protein
MYESDGALDHRVSSVGRVHHGRVHILRGLRDSGHLTERQVSSIIHSETSSGSRTFGKLHSYTPCQ